MYYQEKVIDGVLHFKTTPTGNWTPYTKEELTEMIVKLQEQLKQAVYI